VILIPTIFLPLGIDQSTFVRGGEVLFGGTKLYAQYIEQKPPLIFLLYGSAGSLFGNSDIGYRFFDFLWQLFAVVSLLYCLKRLTQSQTIGFIAAVTYSVLYLSMGHSESMECESFIAPLIIWYLYFSCSTNSNTKKNLLIRGVLLGFCFGFKFTFGILLPAVIFWEILYDKAELLKRIVLIFTGFLFAFLCSLWVLFDSEVFYGYLRVLEYTRVYASNPPINLEFARRALMEIGRFFGDNISLSVTVLASIGVFFTVKNNSSDNKNQVGRLASMSIIILIALLVSIVIERKFNPYHFLRLFIPLSVLVSLGFPQLILIVKKSWNETILLWKVLLIFVGCIGFLMSPIPRCIKNIRSSVLYFTSQDSYWATYQKDGDPALIMVDSRNITSLIRSSQKKGKTFVISTSAGYIYRLLDEHPISKFSMPVYYYATITPKGAYEEMIEEVKQSNWLVIQKNDVHPLLYGHNLSCWQRVQNDSVMVNYLNTNFKQKAEIGAFYVFERNE